MSQGNPSGSDLPLIHSPSDQSSSRKHRRVEGGCADYFLDSYSRLISSRGKATFPCRAVPGGLSPRYLFRRYASLRRRLRTCSSRYLLRRYTSLVVRGATRSRYSTHLPQHAQLVEVVPAFHYLAFIREAEDAYPAHSNRFASGSDAPELALMGAASPPAGHHHVSFGYLILDGGTKVREGLAKLPDKPLDVLGPTLLGTTV